MSDNCLKGKTSSSSARLGTAMKLTQLTLSVSETGLRKRRHPHQERPGQLRLYDCGTHV